MTGISGTPELLAGLGRGRATSSHGRAPRSTYLALAAMLVPALLLLAIGLLAGRPPTEGEVQSGVSVGGHDLGSESWAQASAELSTDLDAYLAEPVTLQIGDRTVEASPQELGLGFDLEATHQRALAIGRGGVVDGARERFEAQLFGSELTPVVTYNAEQYITALTLLADGVLAPPRSASYAFEDNQVVILPSEDGVGIDTTLAVRLLQDAVADFDHGPIEIPTVAIAPEVTTADLERTLDEANRLAGQPVTLFDQGTAWQLSAPELVPLLTVEDGELTLDIAIVEARIGTLSESIHQLARNAQIIRNEDGTFDIQPETSARSLDVEASAAAVRAALERGEYDVTLVVEEEQPLLTTDRLLPLRVELTTLATVGMTMTWPEGAWDLDKAAWASALVYDEQSGAVLVDRQALAGALQGVVAAASRPPTGLRWLGGGLVTTEESQPGLGVDVPASVENIVNAVANGQSQAELVVHETGDPSLAASQIAIRDKLGTSATYYGDSSANRKTNVEVAVQALNGTLIAPNSTFSFNDAIGGTASLDDGYQMGYGIIIGSDGVPRTVPSVAGGICQVATTVFQAAFWAGVPITNRNWHLYWIPKYGSGTGGLQGLDATVDPDYGLDFNFHNPTSDWMAISAWADGEWITIDVWGVNQGWQVVVDSPQITNVVAADTKVYRQEDPSVSPGSQVAVESAQDGFSAAIHRVVKDGAGNVLYDDTFHSFYQPARNVILVAPGYGAGDPEPAAEPVEQAPIEEVPPPEEAPAEEIDDGSGGEESIPESTEPPLVEETPPPEE